VSLILAQTGTSWHLCVYGSGLSRRYTARIDEPFVVFLIGMRINQLWAVHKWMPVAAAMPPMQVALRKDPAKGLLGLENWVRWREVMNVQYWRSFEDLENFALNPSDPHLRAWKDFNQRAGANGSVGIWHETFLVNAGQYECVYANLPRLGLAAATDHVPAIGNRETARLRLGGYNEPAAPSPPSPEAE